MDANDVIYCIGVQCSIYQAFSWGRKLIYIIISNKRRGTDVSCFI